MLIRHILKIELNIHVFGIFAAQEKLQMQNNYCFNYEYLQLEIPLIKKSTANIIHLK